MPLAIFDLDNTLLNGDSDHAFGEFLIRVGAVDAVDYREGNDRYYRLYQEGRLDIREYLAFALEPLARYPKEQLDLWHRQFMAEVITPMRLPQADALLAEHRSRGDFLLIITATNRFVTGPIAAALGVDALIATEPAFVGGRFTGEVEGTPCFREGKVERLEAWLKESGLTLAGSWFYSDSHNDLPLLERVEHPVAVDPDAELANLAKNRGWPILSLRQTVT